MQTGFKKIILKFKDKHFVKGISTLIGASLINFLVGAIYSLCTLSVYEISYIKGRGGSIEIEHLTFYYPTEIFFQCISAFISGMIYKKFGLHKTNLIGVSILTLGYYSMYMSCSLTMDITSMILGGIGSGIILYPSTTNSYEWFRDHNGIIVGIMETMISFGSFFFAFIGEKIINKEDINEDIIIEIINNSNQLDNLENKNQDIDKDDSDENVEIEPKENINIKKILSDKKNLKIINDFLDNIDLEKVKKDEKMPMKSIINGKSIKSILQLHTSKRNNINFKKQKDKNIKQMIKLAIKSKRLILFSIIVILQAPVANMAFSLYREIGEYEKIDIIYLQLVGSLYFIFECLSSFVFGLLCDYIKLKNLLLFINGVGTFVGFTYCLTFKHSWLHILFNIQA